MQIGECRENNFETAGYHKKTLLQLYVRELPQTKRTWSHNKVVVDTLID